MSTQYSNDFQLYRREILEELLNIREQCEVLMNVFLPEYGVEEYYYKMLGIFDQTEGYHESVVHKALMKDKLRYVTAPIHKFILNADAREDYTNNINDYWIFEESFVERKRRYYNNYGKFYELLFAEWLDNNGWRIIDLEAQNENSADIEAISPENQSCAFEIKTYFKNLEASQHQNKSERYFGCGEDPIEIEEKYKNLITDAEEQLKDKAGKKRIVTIIDLENKINKLELIPPGREDFLKDSMNSCDELWIMKFELFELSRIFI